MHSSRLDVIMVVLYVAMLFAPNVWAAPEKKRGAYQGGVATEYPAWFKDSFLDLREDIKEAKSHNKRVMLMFTQDNCPYCNALVERNLSQKEIEQRLRAHFDVIAINVWGDREVTGLDDAKQSEKSYATSQKVQFTPTLLFFDEAGKMILRLNGYLPPERFKTAIEYVAQGKEKSVRYRDYIATNTPPASGGELFGEDFFQSAPYNLKRTPSAKARPLAVFFEQRDCPSCAELHQKVLTDPIHALSFANWR